ncbi:hypothetical protein AB204_10825 [Xenorhabdus khoisanae]|uniref:Uncharacterized protein n=1 Tax=Xenorhabdus khoisanae TaxID=880157 RepID=A0A0J5FS37_9GAMM|nr:GNAT family N-acetyltransferase [Xenorhabdus khoisanae]KMJ45086.1 hypothetical protein AB204_10825 [Xenorhabdus khoisanae]
MVYRKRSLSVNHHHDFLSNPLRETKSTLDMRSVDAELRDLRDIRKFVHIKKGNYQEASYAVNTILHRMSGDQFPHDFFNGNRENERKNKNIGETSHSEVLNLNSILKNHGLVLEQHKKSLTKEENEEKEEIAKNFYRYQSAKTIFTLINKSINRSRDEDTFFIAYYFSNPIGILQLSTKSNIPLIVHFAVHYLTRNFGYLLMEYAVNESLDLGKEGKLQCDALPRAEKAYSDLGFLKTTGDVMVLEPAMNKDKWHIINGRYKYIMY